MQMPDGFREALDAAVTGGVDFDLTTRGIHATDASHYQQMPACVVTPRDEQELVAAIRVAHEYRMPITPRGGGTSLSGQTFGPGIVIDCSRHMDQIIEIDAERQTARVQPGVIRDHLNQAAKAHGLHFAPDPATGNRANIGGMIGNNSSGTRSIVYGKTIDHVISCRIALIDGTVLECTPHTREQWGQIASGTGREAEIYRGISLLIDQHHNEIIDRYPKVMRRVSGYNLDEFVDGAGYEGPIGPRPESKPGFRARPWNLANLIVGSEGTLGVLLEATVRLTPLPKASAVCVVHFDDDISALRAVPRINAFSPSAVEMLDRSVCREAKRNPSTKAMADFIEGDPAALLIVEFFGQTQESATEQAESLAAALRESQVGYCHPIRSDMEGQANVWDTRKLGLGLISNVRGPIKGQAFVEDACVPVQHLAEYIEKLKSYCNQLGVSSSMYAHASVGVIHFRPAVDLHRKDHRDLMRQIAEFAFEQVQSYGGVFAGEHGDGILRGQFIPHTYGPNLYGAFKKLKALFDPQNLMNPNKIVDSPSMTDPDYLRYGNSYRLAEVPATFHYRDQRLEDSDHSEAFHLAVEQCNGVGACRKIGSGTMCPSYMATRDEEDSTRGRANALRLAMTGQLGETDLASHRIQEVLSLCLSCKACKTECPNAVDMAKLKADVTQMHHDRYGTPPGAKLIAGMPRLARFGTGRFASVANYLQSRLLIRRILQWRYGIDRRRPLPRFAKQSLMQWHRQRGGAVAAEACDVTLLADSWSNYFDPHIGISAVTLLESLGLKVSLLDAGDLLRPMLSKGLVRKAKREAKLLFNQLDKHGGSRQDHPILCLEPSDASALIDDLPDLLDDAAMGQRVASRIMPIEKLIAQKRFRSKLGAKKHAKHILLHGHCHQKALFGTESIHCIINAIPDASLTEIDAGCCGMAGSFGYEHYDVSVQIAEQRLLPAAREAVAAGKTIVACGVSCRQQLRDLAGIDAKHLVEVLTVKQPEEGGSTARSAG